MDIQAWISTLAGLAIGGYGVFLQRRALALQESTMKGEAHFAKETRTARFYKPYRRVFVVLLLMASAWIPYFLKSSKDTTSTGIRIISQSSIRSTEYDFPFGLEVRMETDTERNPVELLVVCDGPVGKGHGKFLNGGEFPPATQKQAVMSEPPYQHPDIFIMKWWQPGWTPHDIVVVQLFSKTKIRAQYVAPINYIPGA